MIIKEEFKKYLAGFFDGDGLMIVKYTSKFL